jgi:hypothetical protein
MQFGDVFLTSSNMEKTGLSVSLENTSQKMFNGNDKISKTVMFRTQMEVILVNF